MWPPTSSSGRSPARWGLRDLIQRLNGVRHEYADHPAAPHRGRAGADYRHHRPGLPGGACLALSTPPTAAAPPGGWGGPTNGTALPLAWRETQWSELLWDYLSVWQAEIPAQRRRHLCALPDRGVTRARQRAAPRLRRRRARRRRAGWSRSFLPGRCAHRARLDSRSGHLSYLPRPLLSRRRRRPGARRRSAPARWAARCAA